MQGIGVRYTPNGARALLLEKNGDKPVITGLATGQPGEDISDFLARASLGDGNTPIACGLCPGSFLSVYVAPDESFDVPEVKEYLKWEIQRKMVSDPSDYIIDYAIADRGFAFAGRKDLIAERRGDLTKFVTDVEPVALLNGCEVTGEIGDKNIILVSIEGEGISTVYLDNGVLLALESFPVREEMISKVTPGLDRDGMKKIEDSDASRLGGYVFESIERIKKCVKNHDNNDVDEIVITGAGVYIGLMSATISEKTGSNVTVSDPGQFMSDELKKAQPEMVEAAAAFTTCLGLAVRALEI